MPDEFITVLITAKDIKEARKIGKCLLTQKSVACVNMVKGVESMFWWQGKIDKANEVLLVAKSRRFCLRKIVEIIKNNHSYTVPEVIALPVIGGNKDYLEWVKDSTG